jgi:hypothetical protein
VGEPVRLAVWSGPRNISTALMRAWENRPDTVVVDEPFYAHYLAATGIDHPGAADVVRLGETDWRRVVASLLAPLPGGAAVAYQKHMAQHLLPGIDHGWIGELANVLLIRDPREVVASYTRTRATVTPEDIGLPQQVQLYDELCAGGDGDPPPVIDAGDVLRDPERYLRALCHHVGVGFTDRMLSWPPGPRSTDGPWAPYWYAAVWRSTGFERPARRALRLEGAAAEVAEACLPLYRRLHAARWALL